MAIKITPVGYAAIALLGIGAIFGVILLTSTKAGAKTTGKGGSKSSGGTSDMAGNIAKANHHASNTSGGSSTSNTSGGSSTSNTPSTDNSTPAVDTTINPGETTDIIYIAPSGSIQKPDPTTSDVRVASGVFNNGDLVKVNGNSNYQDQYVVSNVIDAGDGGSFITLPTPYIDIGNVNSAGVPEDDTAGTTISVIAQANAGGSSADGTRWHNAGGSEWHNATALSSLANRVGATISQALDTGKGRLNPKYIGRYKPFTLPQAQLRRQKHAEGVSKGIKGQALRNYIRTK